MAAERILVVDAGTSALRASLVALDGSITRLAAEAWPLRIPEDAAPFGRELDATLVTEALQRLVASAQAPVRAVAFTGQREGMAFLDATGKPLLLSPNIDGRASAEGMAIDAARADEVYRVTGHLPSMMQAPAKLAWLRAHRPADGVRVARVLPLVDWLAMTLTGEAAMSRSLACENGLLDVRGGAVPSEVLAASGFDAALLPRLLPDGAVSGAVGAGALAGTPVVLAGADTQCALLGMGAERTGDAGVPAGWSAPVQLVTAEPVLDAERRTWTGVHAAPDRWVLESNAGETGRAWDWICGLLGITPADGATLAAGALPGARDAMAVIGPRRMRASAMNAGVGALTVPLPLVMSAPSRGDVLRSVLEAVAFSLRANVEQIEEVAGARIVTLRLGGGMSAGDAFAQILADVLDRPVAASATPETASLGAAVLAAVAAGGYASVDAALAAMLPPPRAFAPDATRSAQYDDCYGRWCAMCDTFESGAW